MKKLTYLSALLLVFSSIAFADTMSSRTIIKLKTQHRSIVLNEMQQFLSGLQQIMEALSNDDMETVAQVSRSLGTVMSQHIPTELKQVLPQSFRKLGGSVHKDFDQIALDAESLGDSSYTLSQVGQTLSKCVSCHSMYQIRNDEGNR